MTRLKIALLAGGDSPEREIALQSAAQIEAALDHSKYDITVVDLHGRDWHHTTPDGRQWQVDKNDFSITVDGERKSFDYALIIIHGTPGEDGKLQGYLDMMGIPYSSCPMTSSVITFDKITTKRTLAGRVNLAREIFLRRGEAFDASKIVEELGMPLFVKPNASGSSFGVTKVHTPEELPAAIDAAFAQGDEILIEECITGREMGCGILIAGGKEYIFPITEIVSKKDFFDYQAKYTAGYSDEITPADITPEVKAELNRMKTNVHDFRTHIIWVCDIYHICSKPVFPQKNTADWDFDGSWRFQKGTDTGDISRGVYFKQSFFSDRYAGWYSTDVSSLELLSTFGRKPRNDTSFGLHGVAYIRSVYASGYYICLCHCQLLPFPY